VIKGRWVPKVNKVSKVLRVILAHKVYEVLPDN